MAGCLTVIGIIILIALFINFPLFTIGIFIGGWAFYEWNVNRKLNAKSKKPAIILSVGVILALSGIATSGDVENRKNDIINETEPQQQNISTSKIENKIEGKVKVEEKQKSFVPELNIKSEITNNKIEIVGETNFPDETILLILLKDKEENDIQKSVTVLEGKFSLEAIPIEELLHGEQTLEVSLSKDQPDSVIEIIGENGELLTGNLVDDDKQLLVSAKVNIPSDRAPPNDVNGEKVKVTRVVDGDTIVVDLNGKEEKVRLILVDTPETKHPQMGVQPFGPEASDFTTTELEGKTVTLELGVQERDKYGRLLAYIWIGDKLFNQLLLKNGLARVAVYPPNTKYLDEFNATQDKAKKEKIGIWSIENYAQDDGYKDPNNNKENKLEQVASETAKSNSSSSTESNGECDIKGSKSGIYHVPGSTYYNKTKNVYRWFCSIEEAEKAGYRAPKR